MGRGSATNRVDLSVMIGRSLREDLKAEAKAKGMSFTDYIISILVARERDEEKV